MSVTSASGRVTQVQSTAHWTAIIGAVGLVLVSSVFAVALAAVIIHDGNTQEVTDAMGIVGQVLQVMGIGIVVLAGATQAVSGLVSRVIPGLAITPPSLDMTGRTQEPQQGASNESPS